MTRVRKLLDESAKLMGATLAEGVLVPGLGTAAVTWPTPWSQTNRVVLDLREGDRPYRSSSVGCPSLPDIMPFGTAAIVSPLAQSEVREMAIGGTTTAAPTDSHLRPGRPGNIEQGTNGATWKVRVEALEEFLREPDAQSAALIDDVGAAARIHERTVWYNNVEARVVDLSRTLPAEAQGAQGYDLRKLFEFLLEMRNAIDSDPQGRDSAGEVELARMKMGDVTRRIGRRLMHEQLDDPRAAADYVFATLHGVGAGDLARILGVSSKTVSNWKVGRPVVRGVQRVVTVAHTLTYIRASMTPLGLVMWFDAPRDQLGNRTPLQVLNANVSRARPILIELARGSRGQLAG